MNPESLKLVVRVIREVNTKVLAETEEKGIEKGREEKQLEIAQKLRETLDDTEISKIVELPLEKIKNI